jgi:Domain of unknown function (DUF1918)
MCGSILTVGLDAHGSSTDRLPGGALDIVLPAVQATGRSRGIVLRRAWAEAVRQDPDARPSLPCYDGGIPFPRRGEMEAQKGDRITVESNKVGGGTRTGEVVEVTPGSGGDHYRVRWDDGRETTYFPSGDAHLARGN